MKYIKLFLAVCLMLSVGTLSAQYFGQNKPSYETFDFDVVRTPNFEIYHYLQDEENFRRLATYSELWYNYHQNILRDTIYGRNPLIFYNDHADFQQTNAISGSIGVGTGGVTEAFKNRVVMPVALANQSTYQVLGHELVHAYQFNTILNGDSTSIQNLANLPLWIVEGMAEYMSIGSVDPHTAMWMRDAVLNDDVPTLKQMDNPKYFPYRYGHAFWVFLTGLTGDDMIQPFFKNVAKFGVEDAIVATFGVKRDTLSDRWQKAIKQQFADKVAGKDDGIVGRAILDEKDGGRMNISPSISPNGKYVIFLSEKNLFSTDVFMADVSKGEIVKTIASTTRDGNIDDFNFIESSGTWSPNSKQVAYVGFKQGENILIIKDVERGKTLREKRIKGLPAFANPNWSPDGRYIVLTGMQEGQTDLYLFELETEELTRLTNDEYSELHPSWTADSKKIVFSTDQLAFERGRTFGRLTFNLATYDLDTRAVEHIDVFPGADNLNPVVDTAGHILFLSNRDGYRNMYRFEADSAKVYQLTDIPTGISGISHYSPAISIERKRDRVLYTLYNNRSYSIYRARQKDLLNIEVDPLEVTYEAAKLPRLNDRVKSVVDAQINGIDGLSMLSPEELNEVAYKAKFKLDYIGGGAGVGVGTSGTFGTTTGLAGAVDMLFSDILGNNQFYVSLAMNGEISDFGGSVAYVNRKSKINWGASLSHIPFRSTGGRFNGLDTLPCSDCPSGVLYENWEFQVNRFFEDKVGVFAQLPFSTSLRVEADADFSIYSQSLVSFNNFYNSFGQLIYQDREKQDTPPGFNLWSVGGALVGDNSYFGLTAPLDGHRFRIGGRGYFGEFEYRAVTADMRLYRFYKPVGLAFRLFHYGRYGGDANTGRLFPLYLGSPWYVRGFDTDVREQLIVEGDIAEDNLFGSKMLISNFEVRIPFTGPEQLALVKSGFLFSDLNFFVDGGISWFDFDQFNKDENLSGFADAKAIFSAGASLRVNLFGALILEPYYAIPLVGNAGGSFGLNIIPGW